MISQVDAKNIVAKELVDDWISKNIYPLHEKNVAKKMREDYCNFQVFLKKYRNTNYKKTKEIWNKKVDDFNRRLTANAFDIRTTDKAYQSKMEFTSGVKMVEEDELFYLDNCCGSYTATCNTSTTSRAWHNKPNEKRTGQMQKRESG